MIYAFSLLLLGTQSLLLAGTRSTATKWTGAVVCLLFTAMAALRGSVGTDTYTYRVMIDFFLRGYTLALEPGFLFSANLLSYLTTDPDVLVNLFAVVFFGAVLVFIRRATYNELVYLFAYFAPLYFIGYSMNGLRIGLATVFFLLFFQCFQRRQWIWAGLLGAVAFLFHFSILVAFAVLWLFPSGNMRRRALLFRAGAFLALIGALFGIQGYLLEQIDRYSSADTLGASGGAAGLSGVIKFALFLPFTFWLPLRRSHLVQMAAAAFLAIGLSFMLARFSYAGLRFMDIFLWVIPLTYVARLKLGQQMGSTFLFGLGLAGYIGALFTLRNFFASQGLGESPFIPYHFIWDKAF
ncbi:EpsG family protein [Sagittula sp. S175]|uniref:EpsG family protein n=1 Tax=Sagittula sp. S175 TaxID=3415129 RepID=UPI003C7C4FF1